MCTEIARAASVALVLACCPETPDAPMSDEDVQTLAAFARWAVRTQADILRDTGYGELTTTAAAGRIVRKQALKTYPVRESS